MNIIEMAARHNPKGRNRRALLRSETLAMMNLENPYAIAFMESTTPSSPFSKPNGASIGMAMEKFFLTM